MQFLDEIRDPNFLVFTMAVMAVIVAAGLAISLIVIALRRSVKSSVDAVTRMLLSDGIGPAAGGGAPAEQFRTSGIGEVDWDGSGSIVALSRSHLFPDGDSALAGSERAFDELVEKVAACGVDPHDVLEAEPPSFTERDDGVIATSRVDVHVRHGDLRSKVEGSLAGTGYLAGEGSEIIAVEDAHRTAAERAIEDAVANAAAIARHLGLPEGGLGVVGVELRTLDGRAGTGRVAKVAEITWRRTAAQGVAAA